MAKKGIIALIVLLQLSMMLVAEKNYSDEGIDILLYKENVVNGSGFRDHSISADITGHTLTINFNEDVGIAQIVIRNSNGIYIDSENVFSTPDYATFYINDAGYYRMDITLSNGEQYYGYFQVDN